MKKYEKLQGMRSRCRVLATVMLQLWHSLVYLEEGVGIRGKKGGV